MKKQLEILLGTTKDNSLVFGEYRLRDNNTFSVSFTEVSPVVINLNATVELVDKMQDYIDCHDDASILEMLNRLDCSPSQLPEEMLNSMDETEIIETFYDNSCYSETFNIDDVTLLFDFTGAGQMDCRPYIKDLFISKELFDTLLKAWDDFHLKEITSEALEKLETLLVEVDNQDIDNIVENWIYENKDELI